jgi:hypothetical protein
MMYVRSTIRLSNLLTIKKSHVENGVRKYKESAAGTKLRRSKF